MTDLGTKYSYDELGWHEAVEDILGQIHSDSSLDESEVYFYFLVLTEWNGKSWVIKWMHQIQGMYEIGMGIVGQWKEIYKRKGFFKKV